MTMNNNNPYLMQLIANNPALANQMNNLASQYPALFPGYAQSPQQQAVQPQMYTQAQIDELIDKRLAQREEAAKQEAMMKQQQMLLNVVTSIIPVDVQQAIVENPDVAIQFANSEAVRTINASIRETWSKLNPPLKSIAAPKSK